MLLFVMVFVSRFAIGSVWNVVAGYIIYGLWVRVSLELCVPHTTYCKPTDKDHDKYQHVVTYSDETIIKHFYFNIDE